MLKCYRGQELSYQITARFGKSCKNPWILGSANALLNTRKVKGLLKSMLIQSLRLHQPVKLQFNGRQNRDEDGSHDWIQTEVQAMAGQALPLSLILCIEFNWSDVTPISLTRPFGAWCAVTPSHTVTIPSFPAICCNCIAVWRNKDYEEQCIFVRRSLSDHASPISFTILLLRAPGLRRLCWNYSLASQSVGLLLKVILFIGRHHFSLLSYLL